tara:strand:+ start:12411 stop:12977 length:567 start_codon:yes stop_codon:yes gene_type:complete
MLKNSAYSVIFFLFTLSSIHAQDNLNGLRVKMDSTVVFDQGIDPLSPARAAFYSAVLPGLGQIYNKKYWKVPLVWGAIGSGIYFYNKNDKDFNRYRTAFKLRELGQTDEFAGLISDDGLKRAQNVFKKNRDLSLFFSLAMYALNIIEANVDAHLPDKALDRSLSFKPSLFTAPISNQPMVGVTMNFEF